MQKRRRNLFARTSCLSICKERKESWGHHDEIIVEAKSEIAEEVALLVKDCMEGAFKKLVPDVPFKVEPKIQGAWDA
jgi:hypothetical protein